MPPSIRQFPSVIPLSRAVVEILGIDRCEGYKMAREGRLPGAFRFRRRWYVAVGPMLQEMVRQSS